MGEMISKYFSAKEFRCPESGLLFVDPELLNLLDKLREKMGKPCLVTSGCRSVEHNAKVGGSGMSYHITTKMVPCRAADIKATGGNFRYKLIEYAIELGFGGIGIYDGHVHVDVREDAVMWRG